MFFNKQNDKIKSLENLLIQSQADNVKQKKEINEYQIQIKQLNKEITNINQNHDIHIQTCEQKQKLLLETEQKLVDKIKNNEELYKQKRFIEQEMDRIKKQLESQIQQLQNENKKQQQDLKNLQQESQKKEQQYKQKLENSINGKVQEFQQQLQDQQKSSEQKLLSMVTENQKYKEEEQSQKEKYKHLEEQNKQLVQGQSEFENKINQLQKQNKFDKYDFEIKLESIKDLGKKIEYQQNQDIPQEQHDEFLNKEIVLAAFLGARNAGKSYIVSKLHGKTFSQGLLQSTMGFNLLYSKDNKKMGIIDTQGTGESLCLFKSLQNISDPQEYQEMQNQILQQKEEKYKNLKATEKFSQNFISSNCSILIYVVGLLDNESLTQIDKLSEQASNNSQELYVIHNLQTLTTNEAIKEHIKTIIQNFNFGKDPYDLNDEFQVCFKEKPRGINDKSKKSVFHIIFGCEQKESGNTYNQKALTLLKQKLNGTNMPEAYEKKFIDIFKEFVENNAHKYIEIETDTNSSQVSQDRQLFKNYENIEEYEENLDEINQKSQVKDKKTKKDEPQSQKEISKQDQKKKKYFLCNPQLKDKVLKVKDMFFDFYGDIQIPLNLHDVQYKIWENDQKLMVWIPYMFKELVVCDYKKDIKVHQEDKTQVLKIKYSYNINKMTNILKKQGFDNNQKFQYGLSAGRDNEIKQLPTCEGIINLGSTKERNLSQDIQFNYQSSSFLIIIIEKVQETKANEFEIDLFSQCGDNQNDEQFQQQKQQPTQC